MFITITGELGSGKTTVAKILEKDYGFTFYSTGSIQREIAREKGITTLELNQLMSNDVNNIYDRMIDERTVEISRSNQDRDVVFDSRMAWHFADRSFKVYVTVDAYMAAERVIGANRGAVEQYGSLEEAAESLRRRKQLEDSRFAEIYSVHTTDFSNYDLIVDSTFITPEELARFVWEKAKESGGEQEVYLSPRRLFPTRSLDEPGGADEGNCPVEVIEKDHFYFIAAGHSRVCEKLRAGEKLIPVRILSADGQGLVEKYGRKKEEMIRISGEKYARWEAENAMKFLAYPAGGAPNPAD